MSKKQNYGKRKDGTPRLKPKYCWQDLGEDGYEEYFDAEGTTCDKEDEWYYKKVHNRYQKALFMHEAIVNKVEMVWIWPVTDFQEGYGQWVPKSDLILRNPYKKKKNGVDIRKNK